MWPQPTIRFSGAPGVLAGTRVGGWSAIIFGMAAPQGTAARHPSRTGVRSASGWLAGRRPRFFMGMRCGAQGTARGTASDADTRSAPGWLSERVSVSLSASAAERGADEAGESCDADGGVGGYHLPVMADEVCGWMGAGEGAWIIDGTLGGGGHSERFLEAGASVLGVDRDPEALAHARRRLARFGGRFTTWEGNVADAEHAPQLRAGMRADGLLLDLGVSSRQLDSAARGFSFLRDGPLDMRMGPSSRRTAAEVVNTWSADELTRILREFGEEPAARRIVSAIVARRESRPFATTADLAGCIERVVGRRGRVHPATRAFQALRMAVNDELDSLAAALEMAPRVLKPGGRLLVITFHSLEDRLVKRFLRRHSQAMLDDPSWPAPRPNPERRFDLPVRGAVKPSAEEIRVNPRARSAKLRVARFLDCQP